jgi:hypothetical protein
MEFKKSVIYDQCFLLLVGYHDNMRRKHLVSVVVFVFLSWNVLMYYFLISKNPAKVRTRGNAKTNHSKQS